MVTASGGTDVKITLLSKDSKYILVITYKQTEKNYIYHLFV